MALLLSLLLVLIGLLAAPGTRARSFDEVIRMPGDEWEQEAEEEEKNGGTRWALLVAGSSGYGNYRHQADVCHAYQIMRANGLKDENIVVMMYDDIAEHRDNPEPGKIINHPQGSDVYHGVPKDYTGETVTASNLYAVILGDKNATSGGSGKVIASGPDDHVFIFYSDHGGPGVLGMPTYPYVYANDLVDALKKKHERKGFKEMVLYIEACESGSIFEGLLPEGLGIYVTTASNAVESSWGTYCPGQHPGPPADYLTCLGDLYSVSWMEDSEVHNLKKETLLQQYLTVKDRTSNHNTYQSGSHVMQYGDVKLNSQELSWFIGFDPANGNLSSENSIIPEWPSNNAINQRDADLLHLWHKYNKAREGTKEKQAARKKMTRTLLHRMVTDRNVDLVAKLLFGSEAAPAILSEVRAPGQPLVDDWECLKSMVLAYESKCGKLGEYGMKHMRGFANICNKGVPVSRMATAAEESCAR